MRESSAFRKITQAMLSMAGTTSLIVLAMLTKVILATFTVWSYDFTYVTKAATFGFEWQPEALSPWIQFENLIYKAWLILPINHPGLESWLLQGSVFPQNASAYLLVLMLKIPLILADLLSAFAIYRIGLRLGSSSCARFSVLAWLFNPLVILAVEMDGAIDIIPVCLSLFAVTLFLYDKVALSIVPFLASVAFKLYPIILLPVILIILWRVKMRTHVVGYLVGTTVGLLMYVYWVNLTGASFVYSLLNYNPLTQNMAELLLNPYYSRIGLASTGGLLFCFTLSQYWTVTRQSIFGAVLGFLLVYLAFLDWMPQYLLWMLPFVAVEFANRRSSRVHIAALLLAALTLMLVQFDIFATKQAFLFIPGLEAASRWLRAFGQDAATVFVLAPLTRSIFAGLATLYSIRMICRNSPTIRNIVRNLSSQVSG